MLTPLNLLKILFFYIIAHGINAKAPAEKTYLAGRIIEQNTRHPIDSVRIASSLYATVCYSDPEGTFRLPFGERMKCRADTQIHPIGSEHSVHIAINGSTHRLTSDHPLENMDVQLFDLRGRASGVTLPPLHHSRPFPNRGISPGIYLLKFPGFPAKPFLFTDRELRGTLSRNKTILQEILPPNCPTDDTVYFYRQGYWPVAVPIADARAADTITLVRKMWITFDIHHHTLLTDGSTTQDSVLHYAFTRFGLDLCANSEHGGRFSFDTAGSYIIDDPSQGELAPRMGSSSLIPRWYTLAEYSWPKIKGQRSLYPGKILLQGLEWNVPGHEHASVGFIDDSDQPDAISEFEYRFDFNDFDTSRPELSKNNRRWLHNDALVALQWLGSNYPRTSYFFINHPSREAIGPYPVNAFRDFNNLAPDICFAFEGMPGHHKMSPRGKYLYGSGTRNRTWGGADYICAKRGGMWDALLGEGRHFWSIVNSDFHYLGQDHWPGEYTKSHVAVRDTGARAWLEGMRDGELFAVLGNLVTNLEFTVDDGIHVAGMGTDFNTYRDTLSVTIRYRSPPSNARGAAPRVDHVDLIAGPITGKIDSSDERYSSPEHPETVVLHRFSNSDRQSDDDWTTHCTTIVCTGPTFLRLRGTNNTIGESANVNEQGEPALDVTESNPEEAAWNDLWFYSNPVFVYPR